MSTNTSTPLLSLSKIGTLEEDDQQLELEEFNRADRAAAELVMIGPLNLDDHLGARLSSAAEQLAGCELVGNNEDAANQALESMRWGYRIGVMTGLRLARALEGGAK